GTRRDAGLAIERLGKDPRDGGLADTAGAGEQERTVHAAPVQRIDERAQDLFLAAQFLEAPGPPLAGKDKAAHRGPDSPRSPRSTRMEAARASTPPAPDATATVAPFRAWRDSRLIVAEEPTRATIVTVWFDFRCLPAPRWAGFSIVRAS